MGDLFLFFCRVPCFQCFLLFGICIPNRFSPPANFPFTKTRLPVTTIFSVPELFRWRVLIRKGRKVDGAFFPLPVLGNWHSDSLEEWAFFRFFFSFRYLTFFTSIFREAEFCFFRFPIEFFFPFFAKGLWARRFTHVFLFFPHIFHPSLSPTYFALFVLLSYFCSSSGVLFPLSSPCHPFVIDHLPIITYSFSHA